MLVLHEIFHNVLIYNITVYINWKLFIINKPEYKTQLICLSIKNNYGICILTFPILITYFKLMTFFRVKGCVLYFWFTTKYDWAI